MQFRSLHTLLLFCFFTGAFSLGIVIVLSMRRPGKSHTLSIVCTTGMIADMVRAIAGPQADIQVLMGSGIDPHLYRATESNVHTLGSADLIVCNGLHLEGKMAEIFSHFQDKKKVLSLGNHLPVDELIPLSRGSGFDPHVWHDVDLWKQLITRVCAVLVGLDPLHEDEFVARAAAYKQELNDLNTWVHEMISTIPVRHRILVTAHDAFAYFGKRYGIQVIGLQGVSTESEIAMRDVQVLADFIVKRSIPAIFFESSIPERTIKAVQEAVKYRGYCVQVGRELLADALGDKDQQTDTYVGMITWNVNAIAGALSGKDGV